jgi:hypothetical protein
MALKPASKSYIMLPLFVGNGAIITPMTLSLDHTAGKTNSCFLSAMIFVANRAIDWFYSTIFGTTQQTSKVGNE